MTRYTIADLGTLPNGGGSYAFALNNRGQVVGTADTGTKDEEGDPIYHASKQIAGVGRHNGKTRAFLMTPLRD